MAQVKYDLSIIYRQLEQMNDGPEKEVFVKLDSEQDQLEISATVIQLHPEFLRQLADVADSRTIIFDRSGDKGRITIS